MLYQQSQSVAWNFLGKKVVAIQLEGDRSFHEFNEVASFIWQQLEKPCLTKELVDRLVEEFAVSEAQAQQDVEFFLKDLIEKRLLKTIPSEVSPTDSVVSP